MDVNQVIGKRLAQTVGRGGGTAFCLTLREFLGEEWDKQTYYDAIGGRRFFRVSELIGLARAAGVSVHELVDAKPIGVSKVTMGRKLRKGSPNLRGVAAVTIGAPELVDLFKAPGKSQRGLALAVKNIYSLVDRLAGPEPAHGSIAHGFAAAARQIERHIKEEPQ